MHYLFSAILAFIALAGAQDLPTLPTGTTVFQFQPTFRGSFPRIPCVTVNSATNGTPAVIQDCSAITEDRAFSLSNRQGGLTQIRIFNTFCLQAPAGTDGTKVSIASCADGDTRQLWIVNIEGQIQWGAFFSTSCLDLTDGKLTNGNQLQLWTCDQANANPNQQWKTNPLQNPVNQVVNTGPGNSALCMAASSSANGAPVFAAPCSDTTARNVWMLPQPGHGNTGSYQLAFGAGGTAPIKCLDVTDGVDADGTKLQLWDCNGGINQQFLPDPVGIRWAHNLAAVKCVDLTNGVTTRGNQLQIWSCVGGPNANQAWVDTAPPQTAV